MAPIHARDGTGAIGHPPSRPARVRGPQPARKRQAGGGGAPLNDESGKHPGARHLRGGRAAGRVVLSMATLTATRCHLGLHAFYNRLLACGKAPKVALTAAMRTFLTILQAMVNTRTPWDARIHHGRVPESSP
jgi:transposase